MKLLKKLKQFLFGSFRSSTAPKSPKKKGRKNKGGKVKAAAKTKSKSRPVKAQKASPPKKAAKKSAVKIQPKKKAAGNKSSVKKPAAKPATAKEKELGDKIGIVTHYFPKVNAGVLQVEALGVSVGDRLWFKGATTNFKQKIKSMQINRIPIDKARVGEEIGVEVSREVRAGDIVYKI